MDNFWQGAGMAVATAPQHNQIKSSLLVYRETSWITFDQVFTAIAAQRNSVNSCIFSLATNVVDSTAIATQNRRVPSVL